MGQRGTLFRSAFTNQPVCAPARATLFTGQYPENSLTVNECVSQINLCPSSGKLRSPPSLEIISSCPPFCIQERIS